MDRGKDVGEKENTSRKGSSFTISNTPNDGESNVYDNTRPRSRERDKIIGYTTQKEGMRGRKSTQKKMTSMSKSRTEKGEQ
jgi:hypothetical protein